MLEQILDALKAHPNSDLDTITRLVLGPESTVAQRRKVRNEVSCASADKLIAWAHTEIDGAKKAVYRLLGDDPPDNIIEPKPRPISPQPKQEREPGPPPVSLHEEPAQANRRELKILDGIQTAMPKAAPITTVAELEAAVADKSRDKQERKQIIRSLEQQTKALQAAKVPVQDYMLKIDVLGRLSELFSEDIADVLKETAEDLCRLGDIVGVEG